MKKLNIVIGPPFCNHGEHIVEGIHYPSGSFVTTPQELKQIIENNEYSFIKDYESIVVFGFNGTKKERDEIINHIKYLCDELSEEHFILDIPQESLLYKMFLENNQDLLAIYIFYDCLEISEEDDKIKKIDIRMEYDDLIDNGCSAVIVDIHPLFLNSTQNRIMLNLPNENAIFINKHLCDYLKEFSELGFIIILSHCESNRYSPFDFGKLVSIYNSLFKMLDLDISGFAVTINKKINERFYKPHPWHLFKIFRDYYVNPKSSFYMGYQDIDKKFADFAGIENYIDCSTQKKIEELEKHFKSLV